MTKKETKSQPTGGYGKWAPKLTFEERCGYYYAHLIGTPRDVIALAAGINRSSVTRLTSRKYRAYGEVHLEFDELGLEEFRNRYYTKKVFDRLAAAQVQVTGQAVGV